MASLDVLKQNLRQTFTALTTTSPLTLSDLQYSVGFDALKRGSTSYEQFIIPQLCQLLGPVFRSRTHVSVLEIGPGPESVLGDLPTEMRGKIKKYAAYEPNGIFASALEKSLCQTEGKEPLLPDYQSSPQVHRNSFNLEHNKEDDLSLGEEKYDIILFCHSMYGMKNRLDVIKKSLAMLLKQPEGGMVIVFHRDGNVNFEGLVCHQTISFPIGVTRVADDDESLDTFSTFIAGYALRDSNEDKAVRIEWRKTCRALGGRDKSHPDFLFFSSPEVMVAFNHHATALPELTAKVPLLKGDLTIKNREARVHRPACVVRPTNIQQVQECVRWAIKQRVGLVVIGGGHSGHCIVSTVVSIEMGAFDKIQILGNDGGATPDCDSNSLLLVEAGCKTGDVVRKAMDADLTVPLGARPSVGSGLWLQGGIGHLARLHGLACDSIIGAVVVSVIDGEVLCVGNVPSQYQPVGSIRPKNGEDLLWALKGAGTNFGIVISVIFKAYPARTFSFRNWVLPLQDTAQARLKVLDFDEHVAANMAPNCSADAYLYWESDQLQLGVNVFEAFTTKPLPTPPSTILRPETQCSVVNGMGLFGSEMYMSGMHGGHSGGKTSSFKRCLLLKSIGGDNISEVLVASIQKRPDPQCYIHLLHGGGAVANIPADATAFGCRDWDFACVVTGVWQRDQDGTATARAAVQWVYDTANELLPLSSGVYSADLGPDPRDTAFAALAFGPNRPRLARLKRIWDPRNVLAYTCPIPKTPMESKLIFLVTGDSCAGKDYCADIWVSAFTACTSRNITARAISISEATKREYCSATGADLKKILTDRVYKEEHRPALTKFFEDQVKQRPCLLEEHFKSVVYGNADVDVLFITGMREEAPVVALSHVVPDTRLLEIRVQASKHTMIERGSSSGKVNDDNTEKLGDDNSNRGILDYRPSLLFDNVKIGRIAVANFAETHLLRFINDDLQQLADIVRSALDFPQPGIEFRHILDICQQPGGITLCTSLLRDYVSRDWASVDSLVCCEAGGFIFASALAMNVGIPLALIREAGKLPPPTISVTKSPSHMSCLVSDDTVKKKIEMGRDVIPRGGSVVVVDDVLATGKTLLAILQLLKKVGIALDAISAMVVAEFPSHCGRELLYRNGFGGVRVWSLLVFGGA